MGSVGQIAIGRHDYGLKSGQKALYLFLAAGLGAMAVFFLGPKAGNLHGSAGIAFAAAFAVSGCYLAMVALRSRLIIDGTQVQVQGAVRTREFDLGQVEGYRTYRNRYQTYQVICLINNAGRIPLMKYATDESFDEWFAGLKNLDERDRDQLLEKIDQDQDLGANPEERRTALTRAKQVNIAAWVLDGGAAVAFVWGPAGYRIAAMAVLASMPAVAAYLLYSQPLLYGIFNGRRDPRGDVSPVLMISAFALMLSETRLNFVAMGSLFPAIAIIALALLAIFIPAARKSPQFAGSLIGLCFFCLLYGWGLAMAVDTVPDQSAPQTFSAQVLGGRISHGRHSTSYYLILEPWGPYQKNNRMQVSRSLYYGTRRGDFICLALRAGVLHAAWYEPVTCGSGQ